MIKYKINKTSEIISIIGYDQKFTAEDKKDLWETHKILFLGGVMAVWVEERKSSNPLVHLMGEDDGHIFWSKEKDICFDSYWIDNYIDTLSSLKDYLVK